MTAPEESPQVPPRNPRRDLWQLDIPVVVVLLGCGIATYIELSRATEGVWRAWVYTFEWPLIGVFAIWIWYRYRIRRGVRRPRTSVTGESVETESAEDPALTRWQEYQRRLRENTEPHE